MRKGCAIVKTEKDFDSNYNQKLFKIYQENKTIENRNAIVQFNLGYVQAIAHEYAKKSKESYEDLFQIGTIGLIKAVQSYKLSKKIKFTPYAKPWIKGEILHWLRDKSNFIQIPGYIQETYQKITRYTKKRQISYSEAVKELGIDEKLALRVLKAYNIKIHDISRYYEVITDFEDIVDSTKELEYNRLKKLLYNLPIQYRDIILCRNLQEMSLRDTAKSLNMKISEVRELEEEALLYLKSQLCQNHKI